MFAVRGDVEVRRPEHRGNSRRDDPPDPLPQVPYRRCLGWFVTLGVDLLVLVLLAFPRLVAPTMAEHPVECVLAVESDEDTLPGCACSVRDGTPTRTRTWDPGIRKNVAQRERRSKLFL